MKRRHQLIALALLVVSQTPATLNANSDPIFYLLDNTAATAELGNVYRVIGSSGGKTLYTSLIPPYVVGGMFYWKGFATDGKFFYTLNTDPGAGTIERVSLDGTTRTAIADIDPNPYGAIEKYNGFACDGTYFYLLMFHADNKGLINRIDMDGLNRVDPFLAAASNPVPNVGDCRGFACDGKYFYFLNSAGTEPVKGTIYRTKMDGTGLTTIRDLSPTLFGNLQWYDGFAVHTPPRGTVFSIQ